MKEKMVSALVIGDLHFKSGCSEEGKRLVKRILKASRRYKPTFTVILGDTLDTHEVVRVQPHNLACELIEGLSAVSPVYLLIGNHDLINNSQFLTPNHIFGPLKRWKGVVVVDKPVYASYDSFDFVFCPYVKPGRFIEALDYLIKDGETWDLVDCIFAHQEFRGCQMGSFTSHEGDEWDPNYPPVISGHIHDEQKVGENVFYPGAAIQHRYGENPDKRLWLVTFGDKENPPYFSTRKINLRMKGKRIVHLDVTSVEKEFDEELLLRYQIKLILHGTSEQFKVFRKSKHYSHLRQLGVRFAYHPNETESYTGGEKLSREQVSFLEVLKEVVSSKSEAVQEMYRKVVDEDSDSEETLVIYVNE